MEFRMVYGVPYSWHYRVHIYCTTVKFQVSSPKDLGNLSRDADRLVRHVIKIVTGYQPSARHKPHILVRGY